MSKSRRRQRARAAQPTSTRPSPTTIILAVGAIVIAVAAVAAIVLTQPLSSAPSPSPTGSSSTAAPSSAPAGVALPAYVAGVADPAIGLPIPEIEAASFDGTPVSIKADGRPKMLVFLAHWCPHCQREVPVVQDWLDAGGLPDSVDLISIATGIDPNLPNYPPDAWFEREGWTPPVIVDADNSIAARYGLPSYPYWVLVGADGTVAQRATGELTPAQLDAIVTALAPT